MTLKEKVKAKFERTNWKLLIFVVFIVSLTSYVSYDAGDYNGKIELCQEMGGQLIVTEEEPEPRCLEVDLDLINGNGQVIPRGLIYDE